MYNTYDARTEKKETTGNIVMYTMLAIWTIAQKSEYQHNLNMII